MPNRTANYTAFYVAEPFNPSNLGANATRDFCYYNMLRAWKAADSSFPFVDAHAKTYSVRDGSDWEMTLKPRLHQRLRASKNIILFLSSTTKDSRALREEISYGITTCELPVIVIYPEYSDNSEILTDSGHIKDSIKKFWDHLPAFKNNMSSVPTCHLPMDKTLIRNCLNMPGFMVRTKLAPGRYVMAPE